MVGLKVEISGGLAATVTVNELLVVKEPAGVVMLIVPVVAPEGTVVVI